MHAPVVVKSNWLRHADAEMSENQAPVRLGIAEVLYIYITKQMHQL